MRRHSRCFTSNARIDFAVNVVRTVDRTSHPRTRCGNTASARVRGHHHVHTARARVRTVRVCACVPKAGIAARAFFSLSISCESRAVSGARRERDYLCAACIYTHTHVAHRLTRVCLRLVVVVVVVHSLISRVLAG